VGEAERMEGGPQRGNRSNRQGARAGHARARLARPLAAIAVCVLLFAALLLVFVLNDGFAKIATKGSVVTLPSEGQVDRGGAGEQLAESRGERERSPTLVETVDAPAVLRTPTQPTVTVDEVEVAEFEQETMVLVRDALETAISGALVSVGFEGDSIAGMTNSGGVCSLKRAFEGDAVLVEVEAPGFGLYRQRVDWAPEILVELEKGRDLTVRCADKVTGGPVAGVTVEWGISGIGLDGFTGQTAVTDVSGEAVFVGIPESGRVMVAADALELYLEATVHCDMASVSADGVVELELTKGDIIYIAARDVESNEIVAVSGVVDARTSCGLVFRNSGNGTEVVAGIGEWNERRAGLGIVVLSANGYADVSAELNEVAPMQRHEVPMRRLRAVPIEIDAASMIADDELVAVTCFWGRPRGGGGAIRGLVRYREAQADGATIRAGDIRYTCKLPTCKWTSQNGRITVHVEGVIDGLDTVCLRIDTGAGQVLETAAPLEWPWRSGSSGTVSLDMSDLVLVE